MSESFEDDWAIEWINRPSFGDPCLHVTDRGATGVEDGPYFYSAQEVDRFIEELRAASKRVFGRTADLDRSRAGVPEHKLLFGD